MSYMSRKRGGELNINRISFEVEHSMPGNQYRHIIWWVFGPLVFLFIPSRFSVVFFFTMLQD